MSYPIFCSYYTNNYPYNIYIKQLEKSLKRFNLKYEILELEHKGNWVSNCAQKANSIKKIFYKYPDSPIFWLDADSELLKEPVFLKNFNFDFALNLRDGWKVWSSQIGFGTTKVAEKILNRWVKYCNEYPHVWDQVTLGYAWSDVQTEEKVNTLKMRQEFFLKKTRGKYWQYLINAFNTKAIFLNKQASRLLKTNIETQFTSNDVPDIWRKSIIDENFLKIDLIKDEDLYLKKKN